MGVTSKENFIKELFKARALLCGRMEKNTQEIGNKGKCMEEENWKILVGLFMRVSF